MGGVGLGPWFTGPEADPLRYEIEDLERCRGGGQGIVYPARHRDGHRVAVKLLSDPDLDFERVMVCAGALGRVRHPNLVRQIDVFVGTALCGRDEPRGEGGYPFDVPYTVCEWVDGVDLPEAVESASPARRIAWVAEVARAVAALHADRSVPGGIVHRDVKPGNVRVTPDQRAVLVDYGCARHVEDGPMTEGIGTPGWRAPEVLLDPQRVGQAADSWGVAALAFWSFAGEPPPLASAEEHRQRLKGRGSQGRRSGPGSPGGRSRHAPGHRTGHPPEGSCRVGGHDRRLCDAAPARAGSWSPSFCSRWSCWESGSSACRRGRREIARRRRQNPAVDRR